MLTPFVVAIISNRFLHVSVLLTHFNTLKEKLPPYTIPAMIFSFLGSFIMLSSEIFNKNSSEYVSILFYSLFSAQCLELDFQALAQFYRQSIWYW